MSIGELNLDIRVEDCVSCKNIVIRDDSYYLDDPENPIITITIPGYNTAKVLDFTFSEVNIYNSYSLGLSSSASTEDLIDLPDGLYTLVYAICPYDEIYKKVYYMRQCSAWCDFECNLRKMFDSCNDLDPDLRDKMQHAEWLLKGAAAFANDCDPDKAVALHRKALDILEEVSCRLN